MRSTRTSTAARQQFPTDGRRPRRGRRPPSWSTSPTATRSTCASRRSPSSSATRPCACSPTTARSRARRSGCGRARRSPSTSPTTATSRPPSTGTGCASTTATTARTRRRPRSRSAAVHLPRRVPRPRPLLVPPAHPRGLRPGDGPLRQHPRRPGRPDYWPPVHREVVLTLDDVLLEDGQDRAVQPRRRRRTPRWAASAT